MTLHINRNQLYAACAFYSQRPHLYALYLQKFAPLWLRALACLYEVTRRYFQNLIHQNLYEATFFRNRVAQMETGLRHAILEHLQRLDSRVEINLHRFLQFPNKEATELIDLIRSLDDAAAGSFSGIEHIDGYPPRCEVIAQWRELKKLSWLGPPFLREEIKQSPHFNPEWEVEVRLAYKLTQRLEWCGAPAEFLRCVLKLSSEPTFPGKLLSCSDEEWPLIDQRVWFLQHISETFTLLPNPAFYDLCQKLMVWNGGHDDLLRQAYVDPRASSLEALEQVLQDSVKQRLLEQTPHLREDLETYLKSKDPALAKWNYLLAPPLERFSRQYLGARNSPHAHLYLKDYVAQKAHACQLPVDTFVQFVERCPHQDKGPKREQLLKVLDHITDMLVQTIRESPETDPSPKVIQFLAGVNGKMVLVDDFISSLRPHLLALLPPPVERRLDLQEAFCLLMQNVGLIWGKSLVGSSKEAEFQAAYFSFLTQYLPHPTNMLEALRRDLYDKRKGCAYTRHGLHNASSFCHDIIIPHCQNSLETVRNAFQTRKLDTQDPYALLLWNFLEKLALSLSEFSNPDYGKGKRHFHKNPLFLTSLALVGLDYIPESFAKWATHMLSSPFLKLVALMVPALQRSSSPLNTIRHRLVDLNDDLSTLWDESKGIPERAKTVIVEEILQNRKDLAVRLVFQTLLDIADLVLIEIRQLYVPEILEAMNKLRIDMERRQALPINRPS